MNLSLHPWMHKIPISYDACSLQSLQSNWHVGRRYRPDCCQWSPHQHLAFQSSKTLTFLEPRSLMWSLYFSPHDPWSMFVVPFKQLPYEYPVERRRFFHHLPNPLNWHPELWSDSPGCKSKVDVTFLRSTKTKMLFLLHPGRLTWNMSSWRFWRSFSFLNGWFVGSVLIFQGVHWCANKLAIDSFYYMIYNIIGAIEQNQCLSHVKHISVAYGLISSCIWSIQLKILTTL